MKNAFFLFITLLTLLLIGCSTQKLLDLQSPCAIPAQLNDSWTTTTADKAGFNPEALCLALSHAINSDNNIHGVLIARHGRIVSEIYRQGPDRPINVLYGLWNPFSRDINFNAETLHDARSISKSVVSLALGVAFKSGKLKSLDLPVLQFYPELSDLNRPELKEITVKNLLTMSSGLQWDEGSLPNDETRLYWKKDQARFVLDRPMKSPPGRIFNYNSGGNAVLADILSRATGKPWLEFINENLFVPLEIKKWKWAQDYHDRPLPFTGLRLLPRDMLKLGVLVLDSGQWNGRQVVPSDWIEDSLSPHISTGLTIHTVPPESLEYGYQWWAGTVSWNKKAIRWNAAFGNGGQRIFIVPDLQMVIVTTAGSYGSDKVNIAVNQLLEDVVRSVEPN